MELIRAWFAELTREGTPRRGNSFGEGSAVDTSMTIRGGVPGSLLPGTGQGMARSLASRESGVPRRSLEAARLTGTWLH